MIKFTGDGTSYLPGVPARDLDNDEWLVLSPQTQQAVLDCGLYKMQGRPPAGSEVTKPSPKVEPDPLPEAKHDG